MLADIRELLQETVAADSFWSDPLLLLLANQGMDERSLELAEMHEGWLTARVSIDTVADQVAYIIPEGTGRIKRALRVFTRSGKDLEVPMVRRERWTENTVGSPSTPAGGFDHVPTYRMLANEIWLEPPPRQNDTGGIVLETEDVADRLVNGSDKLDLRYPAEYETLFIYDTAYLAWMVEQSQNATEMPFPLEAVRARYAGKFFEWASVRTFGQVGSTPYYLGD